MLEWDLVAPFIALRPQISHFLLIYLDNIKQYTPLKIVFTSSIKLQDRTFINLLILSKVFSLRGVPRGKLFLYEACPVESYFFTG
jgi:hypothetical protein